MSLLYTTSMCLLLILARRMIQILMYIYAA